MTVRMVLRAALAVSIVGCAACGELAGAQMEEAESPAAAATSAAQAASGAGLPSPSTPSSNGLPHAQPAAAFPNTDDGKPLMQLGLAFNDYASLEQPWINVAKANAVEWNAGMASGSDLALPALLAAGHLEAATFYPKSLPAGARNIRGLVFREGAQYDAIRSYYAGTWVIDWEGEAEVSEGWGSKKRVIGKNRVELEMTGEAHNVVVVNRIGPGGLRNLRVYRKEHEALLDAGRIVAPDFAAYAGKYKILRTMDLQGVNKNWLRRADQLMSAEAPAWSPPLLLDLPGAPRGFPFEPLFQLAVETDTALWMHVAGIIGAPAAFDAPDLYSNGTGLQATAIAHARAIVESEEWAKMAQALVKALAASAYPADRMLYVEENNEIWNWANPFWYHTNFHQGVGMGLTDGQKGVRYAYGYLTARLAHEIEKALADAGRKQAWTPVLAGQMANPATTAEALDGYRQYFTDKGIDPAPWMKMLGVSTASYFWGGLDINAPFVVAKAGETREAAWLRSINEDPQGLARKAADHIINGPASQDGSLQWTVARRAEHQKLAEAAGVFFLGDYEGHSHDTAPGSLWGDPAFIAWAEAFWYGPEGGRLTKAWADALIAQNPRAVIANYYGTSRPIAAPGLLAPWEDGFYTENTAVKDALKPYLRP